jgi:hypothetical protein
MPKSRIDPKQIPTIFILQALCYHEKDPFIRWFDLFGAYALAADHHSITLWRRNALPST